MSSIHVLQSSTSREKLLKSVQSLRPFLCESLRTNMPCFDPYEYTHGDFMESDTNYLQRTPPLYDGDAQLQAGIIRTYNSQSIRGEQQLHMVLDVIDQGSSVQWHGPNGDIDRRPDEGSERSWCTHRLYDDIGCENDVDNVPIDEGGLSGYGAQHHYLHDLHPVEYPGYGHKGSIPILSPAGHMPELVTHGCSDTHSLQTPTLGSVPQDACRLSLESPLQPHNLFSVYPLLSTASQRSYQEFHPVPEGEDIIDGMAASMHNIEVNFHEAQGSPINTLPILEVTPVLRSASAEAQVRETTCEMTGASLPQSHQRKRRRPDQSLLIGTDAKQRDFLDESTAVDYNDGDDSINPNAVKVSGFSSNLACERRRRKKINEALYALRSVVPFVSKMDKASIMADALTYAQQLKQRVTDLQNDILNLQADRADVNCPSVHEDHHLQLEELSPTAARKYPNKAMDFEEYVWGLPKHRILELNVVNMENNTYHIQIRCKKGKGDLVQLARVMEALNFETLNTSVASVADQSTINTVVIKEQEAAATDQAVLKAEEVKETILAMVSEYGLYVV